MDIPDIVRRIFSLLPDSQLQSLRAVSRFFAEIAADSAAERAGRASVIMVDPTFLVVNLWNGADNITIFSSRPRGSCYHAKVYEGWCICSPIPIPQLEHYYDRDVVRRAIIAAGF